jgi:CRP/FNR family cyclic AMP-dependent transcriptional regulator
MLNTATVESRTESAKNSYMSTMPAAIDTRDLLEDPLAYLPCSTIVEYSRGQLIYGRSQPSNSIYLVIDGKVKVCRNADDGRQVVVDIYQPDEFFGECGFLGEKHRLEEAVALDATKVMTWTTSEIDELIVRRPRLGVALIQLLVRRSMDFGARIESFSIDNIGRRLVRSLIRFSERLGRDSGDGSVDMMPFTHELLSQYVGPSREIVTHYMNQLRRQGYLKYSRKGISLNRDALREWLKRDNSAHGE